MNTHRECCFSKAALAAYLDKSIRWVDYQLTGPYPPPGFKIGKSWVFKKSDIDRWLEQFRAGVDLDKLVDETLAELSGKHAQPGNHDQAHAG